MGALKWMVVLAATIVVACSSGQRQSSEARAPLATASAATATAVPPAAPASPTPAPPPQALIPNHLSIPSVGINAPVLPSQTVPDTSVAPPGCPPIPPGDTQVVPNQGIATPAKPLDDFGNKAWIFGHSRWQGVAGIFFSLQDISIGDEIFVDGIDSATGRAVTAQRFVVNNLVLTDIASGGSLLDDNGANRIPERPTLYLQTSVREDGAGKQWILDRTKLLGKARNIVDGDLNDPCKYLLLFVTATA